MPAPYPSPLDLFPAEVWSEIINYVPKDNCQTYCSLALVSKDMQRTVDRFLYRELPFLPPPTSQEAARVMLTDGHASACHVPRSINLLQTLVKRPELQSYVRDFCIQRFAYLGDPTVPAADAINVYYSLLTKALGGMKNLRALSITTDDVTLYQNSFSLCLQKFLTDWKSEDGCPEAFLTRLALRGRPDLYHVFRHLLVWPEPKAEIKAEGDQMDVDIPEMPWRSVVNIVRQAMMLIDEDGFPECAGSQELSIALQAIATPSKLESLIVSDPYSPETYFEGIKRFGVRSTALRGVSGNLLRPPRQGALSGPYYSSEDWPKLRKFEGSIEDLVYILPERQNLESPCIVETGVLEEIGAIEQRWVDRMVADQREQAQNQGPVVHRGKLKEDLMKVYHGLSMIKTLEISVTESIEGAFRFAYLDAGKSETFLSALKSVETLILPSVMLRELIALMNIATLPRLTTLLIGHSISHYHSKPNPCPCHSVPQNQPTWSQIRNAQEEGEVLTDFDRVLTNCPLLKKISLFTHVAAGFAPKTKVVYKTCTACEKWSTAQYGYTRRV